MIFLDIPTQPHLSPSFRGAHFLNQFLSQGFVSFLNILHGRNVDFVSGIGLLTV